MELISEPGLEPLFKFLSIDYESHLGDPKWKRFGKKNHAILSKEQRKRLDNAIWRAWHLFYIKGRRSKLFDVYGVLEDDDKENTFADMEMTSTEEMDSDGNPYRTPAYYILEGANTASVNAAVVLQYKTWRVWNYKRVHGIPFDKKHKATATFIANNSTLQPLRRGQPDNLISGDFNFAQVDFGDDMGDLGDLMDLDFSQDLDVLLGYPSESLFTQHPGQILARAHLKDIGLHANRGIIKNPVGKFTHSAIANTSMMDRIFPSFDLNRKPPMDDESGTSVARNTRQEERWERRRQSQVKQKPYFDSARDNTFTLNSSGSQSALNVTSPNAHPIPGPTPPIGNHTMSDMKAAAAAFYTSALPSIATGTELSQQHTPAQLNAQQQMHPGASGSGYAPQPYPAPNAPGLRTGPVQGQGQDGDNPLGLGAQQQQHQQQFVHTPGHSNHSTPGNFGQDTFGADSQADGAQGGAAIGSPYTHNLQGTPQPSMHTQQMSSLAYSRDNTGPPTSVSIGGSPAGQEVVSPVVMGTQNISSGHLDNAGSNVGALSEGGAGNNLGNSNHDNETNSRRASAESSNTTTQPNATMNHNQFAAPLYPGSAFPTIAPLQIMSQIAPAPANGNPPSTMQYSHIQPNPNQTTAQSQFTKAQSLSENGPSTDGGMKDIKDPRITSRERRESLIAQYQQHRRTLSGTSDDDEGLDDTQAATSTPANQNASIFRPNEPFMAGNGKKRMSIKNGVAALQQILPDTDDKTSKSVTLQKASDHIEVLNSKKQSLLVESSRLRGEINALRMSIGQFTHLAPTRSALKDVDDLMEIALHNVWVQQRSRNSLQFAMLCVVLDGKFESFLQGIDKSSPSALQASMLEWTTANCEASKLESATNHALKATVDRLYPGASSSGQGRK